jgi:hypothetical protein
MRWLDGGQDAPTQRAGEFQGRKERRGIEIVLPGLIDDPKLAMRRGVSIWQDLVDFPPLQGHFITLVAKAQNELGLASCHVSQDNA